MLYSLFITSKINIYLMSHKKIIKTTENIQTIINVIIKIQVCKLIKN